MKITEQRLRQMIRTELKERRLSFEERDHMDIVKQELMSYDQLPGEPIEVDFMDFWYDVRSYEGLSKDEFTEDDLYNALENLQIDGFIEWYKVKGRTLKILL